jgi:hypothetical protein
VKQSEKKQAQAGGFWYFWPHKSTKKICTCKIGALPQIPVHSFFPQKRINEEKAFPRDCLMFPVGKPEWKEYDLFNQLSICSLCIRRPAVSALSAKLK